MKKSNFYPYKTAEFKAKKLRLSSNLKWRKYCKSPRFDKRFPKAPDNYYKNKGWENWFEFLGNKRDKRKYKVNDNYFKKWSHNMAYVFGLWFADGYIRKTKDNVHRFSIKQHNKDRYLLENVLKEMDSNCPIYLHNSCCYFSINSSKIYNNIISLGGKERKSLDCRFPKIPKKYLPDFIRGYFDGDGSISRGTKCAKSNKYFGYKASVSSGSKSFINEFKKVIEDNILGIMTTTYVSKIKKGSVFMGERRLGKDCIVYYVNFSPNNLRRLRDFMYCKDKKEFKLIRKWKKFVEAGDYKATPGSIDYINFDSLKNMLKNYGRLDQKEYLKWIKSDECKIIAPSCPNAVYREEWKGWKNFLGNESVKYHPNRDLTYKKLMKKTKEGKIETKTQYIKWTRAQRQKGLAYPVHPERTFIEEWTNWREFLGM